MLFLSCLPNAGEPVLLDREAAVEKSTKEVQIEKCTIK
jgi:hypothetical protein